MKDLESLTFEGVRKGLQEAGAAIRMIPEAVKDCEVIESDISALVKMAEIFEHPLSLIYHAGKSLIVNGADIFQKVHEGITAYKA